jgi:hypothetical protein
MFIVSRIWFNYSSLHGVLGSLVGSASLYLYVDLEDLVRPGLVLQECWSATQCFAKNTSGRAACLGCTRVHLCNISLANTLMPAPVTTRLSQAYS